MKLRLPPKLSHEQINTYEDAVAAMRYIGDLDQEHELLITVSIDNRIIGNHLISVGSAIETMPNLKIILNRVISDKAEGFIIGHNHPNGRSCFSKGDLKICAYLKLIAPILELDFMDSLLFAHQKEPISCKQRHNKFWSHDYLQYLSKGVDKYINKTTAI
jgi:DNA repair protein RadC